MREPTIRMRWRRLDVPGTDVCELAPTPDGWRLAGTAEYVERGRAARLQYLVECDDGWRTRRGEVRGEVGGEPLRLSVERSPAGEWTVNGAPAAELRGLVDLDLGFTPATNLFPLRRLALGMGEAAEAEAAWLDDATWRFARLPQRYERRGELEYWYESPAANYAGLLRVTPAGFVRDYPGLWLAEERDQ